MSTMSSLASQPFPGAVHITRAAGIAARRWWVAYTGWRIDRLMAARLGATDDRKVNRPEDAPATPAR